MTEKYTGIFEKACKLQRSSPDCLTASGLFRSLLSQRHHNVQISACAVNPVGRWFINVTCTESENRPHVSPIIPFGAISRLVLTSYPKFLVHSRLLNMNIHFLEDKLITPLYEATETYSSSSHRQSLICMSAINESFYRCIPVFWLLNLFQTCNSARLYSTEYHELLMQFVDSTESNYYSRFSNNFIRQTNRRTIELNGRDYLCAEYIVPDILFLAAKDFEITSAYHNVHGYHKCKDCGCLFAKKHGGQKHCCACSGPLRHSYNLVRKRRQEVYSYIHANVPYELSRSAPIIDFFNDDANRLSDNLEQLLYNRLTSQSLDEYMDFLQTASVRIESYCTLSDLYTTFSDHPLFTHTDIL